MRSLRVRRPDNPEDHFHRDDETTIVDVSHLDVIVGHDHESSDDHVAAGQGETQYMGGG